MASGTSTNTASIRRPTWRPTSSCRIRCRPRRASRSARASDEAGMTGSIEITGIRIRCALAPIRRVLNTRVGRFTRGPFLLIDLELKGGGVGRALCFTFIPLAQKLLPPLIEELVATVKGRKIALAEAPAVHDAGEKRLTHLGHEGLAKMALSMLDMALYD